MINLFANGDICVTLSYDPDHAGQLVSTPQEAGVFNWPNTTQSWLPSTGTIGNVNYVAIAYNAKSLLGSLVVANFVGGMAAQYSRRSITPPGIGTIQAYNPSCDAVVAGGWSVPLNALPTYAQTPTAAQLAKAFLPEINGNYASQMSTDWVYCIQQNMTAATGASGTFGNGSGVLCNKSR